MQSLPPEHPILQNRQLWHADKSAGRNGHTMLLCRTTFSVAEPAEVMFWVSASQRFIIYIDGKLAGRGPSRSDQDRWGVRCYPLNLSTGMHTIAAMVTHRGAAAGKAQLGGSGFLLVASSDPQINLHVAKPSNWRSWHHQGWYAETDRAGKQRGHMAVGSGEAFHGAGFPWHWQSVGFDDSAWSAMFPVSDVLANDWGNRIGDHHFREDLLPEMAEREVKFRTPSPFPAKVPAGKTCEYVLDAGNLTNSYIEVIVDGGAGATIELVTCEAPMDPDTRLKGDRNDFNGKQLPGMLDRFYPGGTANEVFTTVWFRAFRYLLVRVKGGDSAVEIKGIKLTETCFPLSIESSFAVQPAELDWPSLLKLTQRTALLCAHETTFDCPHYEQGQFGGDSRIQAIYHYLNCNEDRLIRKCIDDLAASRVWLGILRSHYPANFHQIIPTFSLQWIGMLNEFRIWRGDAEFVRQYLPLAREIIAWFDAYRRPDGLLGLIPYAPFTDWAFHHGNAPQETDGGSSILSLFFAEACGWMAQLESFCGYPELIDRWRTMQQELNSASLSACLDSNSGLMADTCAKSSFSVHAQTQAVLSGALADAEGASALRKAIGSVDVRQPSSFFYRYHLGMALLRCGAGDDVHDLLRPWFELLHGTGLTTLPENLKNPRSDCHAWSVFSGIAPFTHIAGLRPDESCHSMQRLIWQPHPGTLNEISAAFTTPHGPVKIKLSRSGDGLRGWIHSQVEVYVPKLQRILPPGESNILF